MKREKEFYPTKHLQPEIKTKEDILWTANPSQVLNFGWFFISALIFIAILVALPQYWHLSFIVWVFPFWKWLELRNNKYVLTSERFIHKEGVLNRRTEHLELYRVKDYTLRVPLHLRLFGLSNIFILTSDPTTPQVLIEGVGEGDKILSQLRERVEILRAIKGVREID